MCVRSVLRDQWVREGRAFLLVYSVIDRHTFEEISQFRDRILLVNEEDTVPMYVTVFHKMVQGGLIWVVESCQTCVCLVLSCSLCVR